MHSSSDSILHHYIFLPRANFFFNVWLNLSFLSFAISPDTKINNKHYLFYFYFEIFFLYFTSMLVTSGLSWGVRDSGGWPDWFKVKIN